MPTMPEGVREEIARSLEKNSCHLVRAAVQGGMVIVDSYRPLLRFFASRHRQDSYAPALSCILFSL